MMKYKNYIGVVEYDDERNLFHGEVIGTRDVITFQGSSVKEIQKAFKDSVNDYLAFCKERGETPEKPFAGTFIVRVSPEEHRQISIAARKEHKSVNAWVKEHLTHAAVA